MDWRCSSIFIYDESGQILTTSLMDYLIPTAADVPPIEFAHIETPCPISVGGIKGMGEGGAIAPPPAIANAICDALSPFGWRTIDQLPMSPEVVHALTVKLRSCLQGCKANARNNRRNEADSR